jgi:hypothetical protein
VVSRMAASGFQNGLVGIPKVSGMTCNGFQSPNRLYGGFQWIRMASRVAS